MIEKVRENKVMKKVLEFIESDKFIFFATFLTILSNAFSLEFFAWGVAFTVGVITILFSKDLRAILPIAMIAGFSISRKNNTKGTITINGKGDYFLLEDPKGYITIAVLGGILFVLLLIRIFALGDFKKMKKKKYKLKYAFLFLAIAFLTAGLTKTYFSFTNIKTALIMIISLTVCYFLLIGTIDFDNLPFSYFAKFFFSFALISAFAVGVIYLKYFDEISKEVKGVLQIQRGTIGTGWGGQNTIGVVFLMALPFGFYLAITEKRGYIYTILIILTYVVTCFNLSRMTMLFGTIFLIIGSIVLLIKSKKRIVHLIILIIFASIGITAFILFLEKIKSLFVSLIEAGLYFDDRLNLIKSAFSSFKKSPILGVGYTFYENVAGYKGVYGKYHNIIMDMMASSGSVGLILLMAHFYLVIKNGKSKKASFVTTILAISVLVVVSLIERFFFVPPIMLFYSVFLLIIDGYQKEE